MVVDRIVILIFTRYVTNPLTIKSSVVQLLCRNLPTESAVSTRWRKAPISSVTMAPWLQVE